MASIKKLSSCVLHMPIPVFHTDATFHSDSTRGMISFGQQPDKVMRTARLEDNVILCNYMSLIREFLPAAAAEIELDMASFISEQDGYVYDLYAMDEDSKTSVECDSTMYPLIQVDQGDDYYDGPMDSEYETDDSNAENNLLNDYPDEESAEEEELQSRSSYDRSTEEGSAYEEDISDDNEENDWRWEHR